MKRKYLLSLPLVALMTACGSQSGTGRANTKQSLPKDATVIAEDDANYTQALGSLFICLSNIGGSTVMASVDASAKVDIKEEGYKMKIDTSLKADLGFRVTEEHSTVVAGVTIPKVDWKSILPTEQEQVADALTKMGGGKVNLCLTYDATEEGTLLYVDVTDSKVKSGIIEALKLAQDYFKTMTPEEVFEAFFGTGLFSVKVSYLLNALYENYPEALAALTEYLPVEGFADPAYYLLSHLESILNEYGVYQYLLLGAGLFAGLKAEVGYKPGEKEGTISEVFAALNLTGKQISDMVNSAYGEGEEKINISGNAGIYLAAGTGTGASIPSLEDIKVATDLSYNKNRAVSNVKLHVDYNEKAQSAFNAYVPASTEGYKDATGAVAMVIALLLSGSNQSQPQ